MVPGRLESGEELSLGVEAGRSRGSSLGCSGSREAPVDLGDVLGPRGDVDPAVLFGVVIEDNAAPVDVDLGSIKDVEATCRWGGVRTVRVTVRWGWG